MCNWGPQEDAVFGIKDLLLYALVSFVSVCKPEEPKDDPESKADGGEDRDENSKVKMELSWVCISDMFLFS